MVLCAFLGLAMCSASNATGYVSKDPYDGYRSKQYSNDAMWLCRPGLEHNYCHDDLTATEVAPDGSQRVIAHNAAKHPAFDCFYVYPTVDLSAEPGNHNDFSVIKNELDPLLNQGARFNQLCAVYAPLYRQVTIGSFRASNSAQLLDVAYSDVLDAFKQYMANDNHRRPVVLIGHSQGTQMLTRLMKEEFDRSAQLRRRLISALLIGGGGLYVPQEKTVGGTFQHIPVCTKPAQTGCVIGYNSFLADQPPAPGAFFGTAPPGMEAICANPAALGGGKGTFKASYAPDVVRLAGLEHLLPGINTPFVVHHELYSGECVQRNGFHYLAISANPKPGDQRQMLLLGAGALGGPNFGLHFADYNFSLGDLIDIVRKQAKAHS
jgi:hypothetical protein